MRRMVRARKKASALEEDMFRTFWKFVCPALVLLKRGRRSSVGPESIGDEVQLGELGLVVAG